MILRLNKDLEYALISLVEIARIPSGHLMTARQLSEEFEIPFKLLARVLQKLKTGGLLLSVKGANGGYCLAKAADEIRLGSIMKAVRGDEYIADCLNDAAHCAQNDCGCTIKPLIQKLQDKWVSFVESITLKEFVWAELREDSKEE